MRQLELLGGLTALGLVTAALLLRHEPYLVEPAALLSIPVELLLGLVALMVVPARARPPVATALGLALGLVTVLTLLDLGFFGVLGRPFDPVVDWSLFGNAYVFLVGSAGPAGALGAALVAAVVVVAVVWVLTWSVRRLGRTATDHQLAATATVSVLALAWSASASTGLHLTPMHPVATAASSLLVAERVRGVERGLRDRDAFAAEAARDPVADLPADQLLSTLRGKDVVLAFVESYGREALEDPALAPPVRAVLADGGRRLGAAGLSSRSGFLTSATAGGGSWLAHATLLSGLWVDNPQRYRTLVAGDRLTLPRLFSRAGWRTVGVMPGISKTWPESSFFGYDRSYDAGELGYKGPPFGWATTPDQYTLASVERLGRTGAEPTLTVTALVSSHAPWAPLPRLVGWDEVGDGSVYAGMSGGADPPEVILTRDPTQVREDYSRAVEYSLTSLISYAERYGDDDLVLIFLGDHEPSGIVTGPAGRDVPITIVTRDRTVLAAIEDWGWDVGLAPTPAAPVWRMDEFRDRFLAAFGSPPAGPRPSR